MPSHINVLIVARIPLIRAGLRALLEYEPDLEISIAGLDSGNPLLDSILAEDTDVVLLDVQVLENDGWELISDLHNAVPGLVTIVVSDARNDLRVVSALGLGAHGYLLRDSSAEEMAEAIRAANKGIYVLHASAIEALLHSRQTADLNEDETGQAQETDTHNRELIEPLSERELDVLRLMTRGMSNKKIASELFITEHTVKFHIRAILGKLGAANRTEAVTLSLQKGLVTL